MLRRWLAVLEAWLRALWAASDPSGAEREMRDALEALRD